MNVKLTSVHRLWEGRELIHLSAPYKTVSTPVCVTTDHSYISQENRGSLIVLIILMGTEVTEYEGCNRKL